jgi:hypothetical protein
VRNGHATSAWPSRNLLAPMVRFPLPDAMLSSVHRLLAQDAWLSAISILYCVPVSELGGVNPQSVK